MKKNIDACIIATPKDDLTMLTKQIKPFVDKIHILRNSTKDKADYTPTTHPELFVKIDGVWYPHFAALRNANFAMSNNKWIIWLDADDLVEGAENIQSLLKQAGEYDAIGCEYKYKVASDGSVLSSHPKQRIIRNKVYTWEKNPKWVVHENLYTIDGHEPNEVYTQSIAIRHTKSDFSSSSKRNFVMLKWMSEQPELENDPKVWYLLGRDAIGEDAIVAKEALTKSLSMDITDSDRMIACQQLAEIDEALGYFQDAKTYAMGIIEARPDHPSGYIYFSKYLMLLGDYEAALQQTDIAKSITPNPNESIGQSFMDLYKVMHLVRKECFLRVGDYQRASEEYHQATKFMTKDDVLEHLKDIETLDKTYLGNNLMESATHLANYRISKGEDFENVISVLPEEARESTEQAIQIKRHFGKFKKHIKAVAILCTLNFEQWDADTVIQKGGGGSETAVVELARRFTKAGYDTTVYADPLEEKDFEGVHYKSIKSLNLADEFDIFISWRNASIFTNKQIKARKKYLWLQDIMFPHSYPKDIYNAVDKIIVLSKYHRWTAPHVPENKFFYTTNGINIDLIEECEKEVAGERVENECLYCSSADRGLEPLVDMWDIVKTPDATLTWYYGWNSWNKIKKDKESEKWKVKLDKDMVDKGITNAGRVSKRELYKAMFRASYLTYPLVGPAETSCIVLMEAQACGLLPVTTGITALEETQQFGVKVPLEQYPTALGKVLRSKDNTAEYRKEMMKWARETFTWDRVADQWINQLFI